MKKNEFIKAVADKLDTKATATVTKITDAVFETLAELVSNGDEVLINKFGKFKVVDRVERKGRNPKTGEEIVIPAHKTPHFTPSKTFKNVVK